MKRLLVGLCVIAFLAALPLSHVVTAAPTDKVYICHVNSANDVLYSETGEVVVFGRVIRISGNAVDAHIAQHGDSTYFQYLDRETREWFEQTYDIRLPNANCMFGFELPPE